MLRRPRLGREGVLATAGFALLAILLLDPLFADPLHALLDPERDWHGYFSHPRDRLSMRRDQYLAMWVWSWGWQALTTAPSTLFQPPVFHPSPDALATSEHALGALPVFGPILAATGSPVAAYQALLLANIALSGAAMLVLLRHLGTGLLAATLGGFVFTFAPARTDLLFHPHLLAMQWLVLGLVALDKTLTSGRPRWALAAAALLLLEMLSSYSLAYMALVATAAWVVGRRLEGIGNRRGLLTAAGAVVLAGLPVALLSVPYLRARAGETLPDYAAIPGFLHWLSNGPFLNSLIPGWLMDASGIGLGRGGHAWLGLLPLALAATALAPGRGGAGGRGAALAVLLAGWLLALGSDFTLGGITLPLPWRLAADVVPGFSGMRAPHRFSLVLTTGFATLVGLGADRLLTRAPWRAASVTARLAVVCALGVLIGLDYGLPWTHWPLRSPEVGTRQPQIYDALTRLPPAPLLELPLHDPEGVANARAMLHGITHRHPLLNGSSGYTPRPWVLLGKTAADLPAPGALRALARSTGLRRILVHHERLDAAARALWRAPAGLHLEARTKDPSTGETLDTLWAIDAPPPADLLETTTACARQASACAALEDALAQASIAAGSEAGQSASGGAGKRIDRETPPAPPSPDALRRPGSHLSYPTPERAPLPIRAHDGPGASRAAPERAPLRIREGFEWDWEAGCSSAHASGRACFAVAGCGNGRTLFVRRAGPGTCVYHGEVRAWIGREIAPRLRGATAHAATTGVSAKTSATPTAPPGFPSNTRVASHLFDRARSRPADAPNQNVFEIMTSRAEQSSPHGRMQIDLRVPHDVPRSGGGEHYLIMHNLHLTELATCPVDDVACGSDGGRTALGGIPGDPRSYRWYGVIAGAFGDSSLGFGKVGFVVESSAPGAGGNDLIDASFMPWSVAGQGKVFPGGWYRITIERSGPPDPSCPGKTATMGKRSGDCGDRYAYSVLRWDQAHAKWLALRPDDGGPNRRSLLFMALTERQGFEIPPGHIGLAAAWFGEFAGDMSPTDGIDWDNLIVDW